MASPEGGSLVTILKSDIITTIIARVVPRVRIRLQTESLGLFAVNLASGIPLLQTIDISRQSMPWQPFRNAMNALYEALSEGQTLLDALKTPNCRVLPPFIIMVLGSDLTDVEKGNLIRMKYSRADVNQFVVASVLSYSVCQLAITGMTCISLVMFVLPQFREIFSSLHVPLPAPTQLLMSISDYIFSWFFLVVPAIICVLFVGSFFVKTAFFKRFFWRLLGIPHSDFAKVIRVLAEIPPDRIEYVLKTVSMPLIMPASSEMVEDFREAFGSGQPVDAVLVRHGFEPQAAWMVRLAIEGKGTRENFSLAADLIEARTNGAFKRSMILLDTLAPILLALFVGFVAISVFLPMVQLLECM